MYQRQLQRHIERASARHLRATQSARLGSRTNSLAASSVGAGSEPGPGRLPQQQHGSALRLESLSEERGASWGSGAVAAAEPSKPASGAPQPPPRSWEVEDAAVETCPAALGASWLPTLTEELDTARGSGSGAVPQVPAPPGATLPPRQAVPPSAGAAAPALNSSNVSRAGSAAARSGGGSVAASHRTLADIRGLFDAAAEEAAQDRSAANQ